MNSTEIHWRAFFFFFLLSNEYLLIYKKKTPKYIGSIQECTYQIQKLHKSSKSKIEEKGWFLHTANQSNKVLKNRSFRSGIERSLSSKHLLFLSFQIHHIKQWGTTIHIFPLQWRPNPSKNICMCYVLFCMRFCIWIFNSSNFLFVVVEIQWFYLFLLNSWTCVFV